MRQRLGWNIQRTVEIAALDAIFIPLPDTLSRAISPVVAAVADRGRLHTRIFGLGLGQRPQLKLVVSPHRHLRRLERIWVDSPIYFVTTCTHNRRAILARPEIAEILIEEWKSAHDRHGWAVGRYVIMPDHVHFFCRPEYESKPLSGLMAAWKSWSSRRVREILRPATAATTPLWQREFFDHMLRSSESYTEKWNYVLENPVRAGLVMRADDWPYAGEIESLML